MKFYIIILLFITDNIPYYYIYYTLVEKITNKFKIFSINNIIYPLNIFIAEINIIFNYFFMIVFLIKIIKIYLLIKLLIIQNSYYLSTYVQKKLYFNINYDMFL